MAKSPNTASTTPPTTADKPKRVQGPKTLYVIVNDGVSATDVKANIAKVTFNSREMLALLSEGKASQFFMVKFTPTPRGAKGAAEGEETGVIE